MDRLVAPKVRLVLQARTTSTRLPRKVLLPISGMSIVLLAARRARGDHDLVVATSTERSDDALADHVGAAGVAVVRGPLEDVLGRFLVAVEDMADTDLCARLTADNVVPDSSFIGDLIDQARQSGPDYLCFGAGLPYGLSAEIFPVGALRQAGRSASAAYDREHVTPWLRRSANALLDARPNVAMPPDASAARCTIDTEEDYRLVRRLFEGFSDPVGAPWTVVVRRLMELRGH